MRISSAEEYRRAIEEMERLEGAEPGSPEDKRRLALQAAAEQYQHSMRDTEHRKGRPNRSPLE